MHADRDRSRDGLRRRLRSFVLQNFEPFWRFVERVPFLARIVNKAIINSAVKVTRNRPHPFSTASDYTSWLSLTDHSFFARHLPPLPAVPTLPERSKVLNLFRRRGAAKECRKSTLLFPAFAQYLTDGFLRTDMLKRERTTSNHDIDMSTLYGRTRAQTDVLRSSEAMEFRGGLKSQIINGEEYPPFLFDQGATTERPEFLDANGKPILDPPLGFKPESGAGYERQIFAVGGDRVNATPLVCMINTLFLREHNRIARKLTQQYADWDDERVFQTARNIITVMFIKIVIEEYINHISSACFRLKADPKVAWKASWNRPNWMTIEFALLYRWHSLIPDKMSWGGATVDAAQMLLDNRYLTRVGLSAAFQYTSAQNATEIGLLNTAAFLEEVEDRAIQQGRDLRVPRYNDYRLAMDMKSVDDFGQITGDPERQALLKAVYGRPEALEFYTGLFAEDVNLNTPMPMLIGTMVALDAFSQALTNPLLSEHVFNARTFSPWGLGEIERTDSLWSILQRNVPAAALAGMTRDMMTMTRRDWERRRSRF
jgi:prostaglandin-endoperoxide synthase 2